MLTSFDASDNMRTCPCEYWKEQFSIIMLEQLLSVITGWFALPHLFYTMPWMMQFWQEAMRIPPPFIQFTVGLLCPTIDTLTRSEVSVSEDNFTSVVMLINMLLARLSSA